MKKYPQFGNSAVAPKPQLQNHGFQPECQKVHMNLELLHRLIQKVQIYFGR